MDELVHLQENAGQKIKQGIKNVEQKIVQEQKPVVWASEYYHKHKPPKNKTWKEIVKLTEHGDALYHPQIDIETLETYAWQYGTPTTNGKNWKVFKNDKVIGAKRGKGTQYMRIECSANCIHVHPILEAEYLKLLKNNGNK